MQPDLGIDAPTWLRINPLLDAALELPAAEREAWLTALPAQQDDLKALLRKLLARARRIDSAALLEALPAIDTTDDGAARAAQHSAGELIGPYRLLRELGVGGMGAVWLAERADGLMAQRHVALKLPFVAGGPFHSDLAARIAREREILATLDHPHIARLYDAGVAAGGQPFLALEYVDGQRIDHWCEERHLDIRARLHLFLQAARAVAQAHAQLVVHRDIKPSNLLVDAAGQVKLLDFGIAKLLDDGAPMHSDLTHADARVLTPDYAAPEQIAGRAVGTRCDVYALGVVLFELLAGTRPYRLKRQSRAALEEAILAAEVPRPSDVVVKKQLHALLRGDLDTIVLKALKKNTSERYASVDAMAEDVERHLNNRPVLARPDSAGYRLRKFIVRNRVPVAAVATLMLTVLGGAGAALWQARIAQAERARAEDVKTFVAAIFREANPYQGSGTKALSAVDLLKQAEKRLDATLAGRDDARVELTNMIGESLLALGDVAAAEPVIARAVAEAGPTLGPTHAQTLRSWMIQSEVHRLRGRPREALADLERALPALREHGRDGGAILATALMNRALIAIDLGTYAEAEQFARESSELARTHLSESDPQQAGSAAALALVYFHLSKYELARDSGERALRLAIAAHGEASPHPRVIEARSMYARTLAVTGDLVRGIAMLEAALADNRALLGPSNLHGGMLMQNLVGYRVDLGELERADANAAEALAVLSEHFAPGSFNHAMLEHTRAATRLARRDHATALTLATRSAESFDKLVGASHEVTIGARTTVAMALMMAGRLDAAAREVEAVVPHLAALAPTNALLARVAVARGTIARVRGQTTTALDHLRPLVESNHAAPKWQRERMRAWAQIGFVQLDQGAPAEAIASFERAIKEFERLETKITPARADALVGLGRAHLAQDEPTKALPLFEQAEQFWRTFDPANPLAASARDWLARTRAAQRS
jgi:eukaryotic-like serine/threonine-protein kinase